MTTPAAATMIAQAILFPVIASIIELFEANAKGDGLAGHEERTVSVSTREPTASAANPRKDG
jgi:hypothetical protein